jgi:hypothetical protein
MMFRFSSALPEAIGQSSFSLGIETDRTAFIQKTCFLHLNMIIPGAVFSLQSASSVCPGKYLHSYLL